MDGFNFPDVPDAITILEKIVEEKYHRRPDEIVEYSDFLKDFVGPTLIDEFESDHERTILFKVTMSKTKIKIRMLKC